MSPNKSSSFYPVKESMHSDDSVFTISKLLPKIFNAYERTYDISTFGLRYMPIQFHMHVNIYLINYFCM